VPHEAPAVIMDADVLVIGGGLAGISAALELSDKGRSVLLVERRSRLSGVAGSFRRGELTVDTGQHVFLRCCIEYRRFLDRLGVADGVALQPHLHIPVLRPDGRQATLGRTPGLPAPLHLSATLARYGLLSPANRARAIAGALALKRLDPEDPELDQQTLGGYLRRHHQNDAILEALWGVVAVATLNLDPDEASLALAVKVFRTGLLDKADAADVGYAIRPLGELHDEAAAQALAEAGVEVLTATTVKQLDLHRGSVSAGLDDRTGSRIVSARTAVLAVPNREAGRLAPSVLPIGGHELGASPIVNVHLIYDRPLTTYPFVAAVGSAAQWIFDRSESSGLRERNSDEQYLAVTVSAADEIVDVPSRYLVERFDTELRRLFGAPAGTRLVEGFVTRERRATFRQAPGSARLRASIRERNRLVPAGAWTATGWPDTMESAVRSGITAARQLLSEDMYSQEDLSA
jgi:squalene-associated FAD-dependent desaturase